MRTFTGLTRPARALRVAALLLNRRHVRAIADKLGLGAGRERRIMPIPLCLSGSAPSRR